MKHNIKSTKPIIWSIAGSDCSGGAGIAADIKTGHVLNVEVCHIITANTVQNSHQLLSVNPIDTSVLQQQVDVLRHDKKPDVIKIGLVANAEQAQWLAAQLQQLKKIQPDIITVYDPVGQASVGGALSTLTVDELSSLLVHIDIVTPNLLEARTLAQLPHENDAHQLAKKIYQDFTISSVIIKGGHQQCQEDTSVSIDYCYHQLNQLKQDNQDKVPEAISYQLSSPRVLTHYSHGGGCSFATAISSFLAHGYLIRDAFTLTKAYINQGLFASEEISAIHQHSYYGAFQATYWPQKAQHFPSVIGYNNNQLNSGFASLNLNDEDLGLYPVIGSLFWLKRLLPLKLNIIQLRVKNLPQDELEAIIIEAIALAKEFNTRLFINDYWQLAIKHGAYGVHIGQEDLADADLVKIQTSGIRLGISTHGCYEFLLAQQLQPSYLAVGAIFPTKTKDMTGQIQGIDNLKQLLALRKAKDNKLIPVVAIGGITLENAQPVIDTDVDSIAVVTAITESSQPEVAVEAFKQLRRQSV